MRRRLYLYFNAGKRPWDQVASLLMKAGITEALEKGPSPISVYGTYLYQDDPRLDRLREALAAEGLSWGERPHNVYTVTERLRAPLLVLFVRTAERGYGGPTHGTAYDLSQACSRCGTGARQTSPLWLKRSEVPRTGKIFQTLDHEVLVSPEVAAALARAASRDLELRPAVAWPDGKPLPWVQLIPHREMPPMAPSTRGIVRRDPCPQCGRDGYFHTTKAPLEVVYEASRLPWSDLPYAAWTYERFGWSHLREPFPETVFAAPMLLVRPPVWEVLRAEKVRGIEVLPVVIL